MAITVLEIFNKTKNWLKDTSQDYMEVCFSKCLGMPYFMSISPQIKRVEKRENDINLIMQFYIDKNSERQKEILAIYKRFNKYNAHKMNPIPVCKIPLELLGLLDS